MVADLKKKNMYKEDEPTSADRLSEEPSLQV